MEDNHNKNWLSPVFCSLDAEMTGFDTENDEIIELGLVFFRLTQNDIKIEHEWEKIFKPMQNVKPRVLGLTGINNQELAGAPLLSELLSEIKEELKDAQLVGHNLIMDLKFLEALGIVPSKPVIDTLELVQIILPTYHSYNLEHLTHAFGIQEAVQHRALSDARATARLLSCLIRIYRGYPGTLHKQACELIETMPWTALLDYPLQSLQLSELKETRTDTLLRTSQGYLLAQNNSPAILVNSDKNKLLENWRSGLLHLVPSPKDRFSPRLLKQLINRSDLNYKQNFSALKLLVWANTNWQLEAPIDLNLSFSGQGAGGLISEDNGEWTKPTDEVLAMDFVTYLEALQAKVYKDRNWVIENLEEFEEFLTAAGEKSVGWQGLVRLAKDQASINSPLEETIAAIDLFFGVLAMKLKKYQWLGKEISVEELDTYTQKQLHQSAQRLSSSLMTIQTFPREQKVARIRDLLNEFFTPMEGFANWIEVSDIRYRLISRPILPDQDMVNRMKNLKTFGLVSPGSQKFGAYIQKRLGMEGVKTKYLPANKNAVDVEILAGKETRVEELSLNLLPSVVIFKNQEEARMFYETYGMRLRIKAALFLHRYSGGMSKIMKNFGLREHSLMLATMEMLATSKIAIHPKSVIYINCGNKEILNKAYDNLVAKKMGISEQLATELHTERLYRRALANLGTESLKKIYIVEEDLDTGKAFAKFLTRFQHKNWLLIHTN